MLSIAMIVNIIWTSPVMHDPEDPHYAEVGVSIGFRSYLLKLIPTGLSLPESDIFCH